MGASVLEDTNQNPNGSDFFPLRLHALKMSEEGPVLRKVLVAPEKVNLGQKIAGRAHSRYQLPQDEPPELLKRRTTLQSGN